MKSIALLRSEHRDIETMLDVLEMAASRLRNGAAVRPELLSSAVAFFEGFGNHCHHEKEEKLLFPLLAKYGVDPGAGCIRALQAQHEVDRGYLREIKGEIEHLRSDDTAAGGRLAAVLQEYVQLLKEHIRIEEGYLDRLIAQTISPADDARLVEQFQAIDRQTAPPAPAAEPARTAVASPAQHETRH